jgi:predicted ArsR family transcriptional regulator
MNRPPEGAGREIQLLSPHGELLLLLAEKPDVRVAELAKKLRTSTKTVQRRLAELEEAKLLQRSRKGSCTIYHLAQWAQVDPETTSLATFRRSFPL